MVHRVRRARCLWKAAIASAAYDDTFVQNPQNNCDAGTAKMAGREWGWKARASA